MPEMFSASVDAKALLAMFNRVGPSLDFHLRDVARETAAAIAGHARGAVSRDTGQTAQGIHDEPSFDKRGYVVMGYTPRKKRAPVDRFLEHGTRFMRARPFFFGAAARENATFLRRVADRIQQVLNDLGR